MGCTGCNDGCFDESVQLALGPAGSAGTNGSDGLYGGWSLKWKFDSNVGSGTGSSEVRLNNASPVSATVIYVNDNAFGTGAANVFLSSVTSAPYGRIKIFKEYDSTIFWLATITAADDTIVPAEVKFTVTDVVTNGSFTDGDDIVLTLAPAGATGSQGPIGLDGAVVLDYKVADGGVLFGSLYFPGYKDAVAVIDDQVTDTTGVDLKTTIPPNTLVQHGDFLRIRLSGGVTNTNGASQISLFWDGTRILQQNVGSVAMYNLGSLGFDLELDLAFVDPALFTGQNMQTSVTSSSYSTVWFVFVNAYGGPMNQGKAMGGRTLEDFTIAHEISIKATQTITDTAIIDFDEVVGDVVMPQVYITNYEIVRYRKI
jgi:hypothetical protein